jgi:hypothetical protein
LGNSLAVSWKIKDDKGGSICNVNHFVGEGVSDGWEEVNDDKQTGV